MKRFVEGADRGQSTLLPECLDDWISEDNPVRAIDVFVDELDLADLADLGFGRVDPKATCSAQVRSATASRFHYLSHQGSHRRTPALDHARQAWSSDTGRGTLPRPPHARAD
jgi:hypothetical protein